jgi:ABC-type transporter Mla MlaB component
MLFINQQGVVELPEALSFSTVAALVPQGCQLLTEHKSVVFDLSKVQDADSAGLAAIVAWCRFAKKQGLQSRFIHLPASLQALMVVTNMNTVLCDYIL